MRTLYSAVLIAIAATIIASAPAARAQQSAAMKFKPLEGSFVIRDFHFHSGAILPELRMHYMTLGKLARDAQGRATNAVLILHGTGGSGRQFLAPQFANVLFGPGQLLDVNRYYIILPDNIGHGRSSKPSEGLRMRFPHYDYADMVKAQHRLVTVGLGVNHLRLVMGTSMGCMHSWLWGEMYPGFENALMPLACLTVPIAGRNRIWRQMVIDAIHNDPAWMNGNYTREPREALRVALDMFLLAVSSPLQLQEHYATPDAAVSYLENFINTRLPSIDADDLLYQIDASRDYDPSPQLEKIEAQVMYVNSADDFVNPPELGIAQREIKKVKHGRFVLIPISDQTHGHSTHTWAAVWQQYLAELLEESGK